jgi:hypothetical protein
MKNKKITIDDLARMTQKGFSEVDEKIDKLATKDELKILENKFDNFKSEMSEFKSETLTSFDKVLTKLDILIEDKDIRNHQDEQKRKFFGIMVKVVKNGKATPSQLEEISKLNVL